MLLFVSRRSLTSRRSSTPSGAHFLIGRPSSSSSSKPSFAPEASKDAEHLDSEEVELDLVADAAELKSAAAYLLEMARREEEEEAETPPRKPPLLLELQEKPWDGDEPQERALRRILEDSYKPLRIKGWKKAIPVPAPLESRLFEPPRPPSTPSSTPKNVWDYEFRSPTERTPSIRMGTMPTRTSLAPTSRPVDRSTRLALAREKTLDYGSGFGRRNTVMVPASSESAAGAQEGQPEERTAGGRRPMGGMRAWNTIVEDKIEEARKAGVFKNLKGRGKPIPTDENETNPFIARDEFLINRIVQSQGAAPPWIELQLQLETELSSFRANLNDAWFRRATRVLSLGGVSRTSIQAVQDGWRDPEWEARERSYQETAVAALNSVLRKYNTVAPYAVRRAPIVLDVELEKCFKDTKAGIEKELRRRLESNPSIVEGTVVDTKVREAVVEEKAVEETMWTGFKRLVRQVVGNEGLMVEQAERRRA